MSHVSDFTQSSSKIVLDLINEDNNTSLTPGNVTLEIKPDVTPASRNTAVEIAAVPGSGYVGTMTLEYNRLDIQDFVDLYEPAGFEIVQGEAVTVADLMPEINQAMAINLVEDIDFFDQLFAEWAGEPNETQLVNVPIIADSLVYTGTLSFTLKANAIPLASVITVTVMDGLNLPSTAPDPLWWTVDAGFRQIMTDGGLDGNVLQEMHYGFSDAVMPNYGSIIDTKPGQTVVLREAVAIRNFQTNEWSARVAVDGALENLPTSLEVYDVDGEAVVFTADFDDVNNSGGVYFYFFTNLTTEQSLDGNFRFRLIF